MDHDAFLWFVIIPFTVYLIQKWCKKDNELNISENRLDNKLVIVTGANSGIGYEVALDCAKRGASVILACRNETLALEAQRRIIEMTGNRAIKFKTLDLASFQSIHSFVGEVSKEEESIYCLVNNAGLFWVPYMETKDGIESNFGVNHLGHFLLTMLLLPLLTKEKSRVVFVGSLMYMFGKIHFNDLNFVKRGYDFVAAYADSKLANILTTRLLAKKLKQTSIKFYCADPGIVATNIGKGSILMGSFLYNYILKPILQFFVFRTAKEGAQAVIYCVCSEEIVHDSGHFYTISGREKPWAAGRDDKAAEILFNKSMELCKLSFASFSNFIE
eukprot:TCONS_00054444-protein